MQEAAVDRQFSYKIKSRICSNEIRVVISETKDNRSFGIEITVKCAKDVVIENEFDLAGGHG
jgi:hypothetical protein